MTKMVQCMVFIPYIAGRPFYQNILCIIRIERTSLIIRNAFSAGKLHSICTVDVPCM